MNYWRCKMTGYKITEVIKWLRLLNNCGYDWGYKMTKVIK